MWSRRYQLLCPASTFIPSFVFEVVLTQALLHTLLPNSAHWIQSPRWHSPSPGQSLVPSAGSRAPAESTPKLLPSHTIKYMTAVEVGPSCFPCSCLHSSALLTVLMHQMCRSAICLAGSFQMKARFPPPSHVVRSSSLGVMLALFMPMCAFTHPRTHTYRQHRCGKSSSQFQHQWRR